MGPKKAKAPKAQKPKEPKTKAKEPKGKGKGKKGGKGGRKKSKARPYGIVPIILSPATQELFECRADENITQENPYKLLKKDDILQDISMKAKGSDFSPAELIVLKYTDDDILLVYDKSATYGQSFYLDMTPEAKVIVTKIKEMQTPEASDDDADKDLEPTILTSVITEREIREESVREKEKLTMKVSRVQKKSKLPVTLSDYGVADSKTNYVEVAPYQDSRPFIKLVQRDCGVQAVSRLQSSTTQTQWKRQRNAFTQHSPRDMTQNEKEALLQTYTMEKFCTSVAPRMIGVLQEQSIADVFVDDFDALGTVTGPGEVLEKSSDLLVLHQGFTDKMCTKDRKISCVNWHPTIQGVIAVSLTEKRRGQVDESIIAFTEPSYIVFYSFSDPFNSQLLLRCPDDILCFEFCPSNHNIIAGGCVNGQVVLWDITSFYSTLQGVQAPSKPTSENKETYLFDDKKLTKAPIAHFCAVSALKTCHKAGISDICWLPPSVQITASGEVMTNEANISVQIITCALDGSMRIWDVRIPRTIDRLHTLLKGKMDQRGSKPSPCVPETFKHLERTWRPLYKVPAPLNDSGTEFIPYKFSLHVHTVKSRTGKDSAKTTLPDYSQLKIPPYQSLKIMADFDTTMYAGTEDGEVLHIDWTLGKDDTEQLNYNPRFICKIHTMSVNTVQRSPFFKDIILTAGGMNFAIWCEGVKEGPLVQSQCGEYECTAGCWSESRPSIFFIGKSDDSIEVWNLLENNIKPVHVQPHVTSSRITGIKPWTTSSKKHFLAVTDDDGVLRIFQISRTLFRASKTDIASMEKYFETEKESMRIYYEREELELKEKKKEEQRKSKVQQEPLEMMKFQINVEEQEIKKYSEYMMMEESVLRSMGLWPAGMRSKAT